MSLLEAEDSPLWSVLSFGEDLSRFLDKVQDFQARCVEAMVAVAGDVITFPDDVRQAVASGMRPVDELIANLESFDKSVRTLTNELQASDDFVDQAAAVLGTMTELADRHLANYTGTVPLVLEQLTTIQTFVSTIDAVLDSQQGGGLGLESIQGGTVSVMDSSLPMATSTVLQEAQRGAHPLANAARKHLASCLEQFNHTLAVDNAALQASGAANATIAALSTTMRNTGAASLVIETARPFHSAVAAFNASVSQDASLLAQGFDSALVEYAFAQQTNVGSLQLAATLAQDGMLESFDAITQDVVPQALKASTYLLANYFQTGIVSQADDALVEELLALGHQWTDTFIQQAFAEQLFVREEAPLHHPPSVWSRASDVATKHLANASHHASAAVTTAASAQVNETRSRVLQVDKDLLLPLQRVVLDAAADALSSTEHSDSVLGVSSEEVQWHAATELLEAVGTPMSIARFGLQRVVSMLSSTLAKSQLMRLHAAFEYAVEVATYKEIGFSPDVPGGLIAAKQKVTSMHAALADIHADFIVVAQYPRRFEWTSFVAGLGGDMGSVARLRKATDVVVRLAHGFYAEDDPDVDSLFGAGLEALRHHVSPDELAALVMQLRATVELLWGCAQVELQATEMGGVLRGVANSAHVDVEQMWRSLRQHEVHQGVLAATKAVAVSEFYPALQHAMEAGFGALATSLSHIRAKVSWADGEACLREQMPHPLFNGVAQQLNDVWEAQKMIQGAPDVTWMHAMQFVGAHSFLSSFSYFDNCRKLANRDSVLWPVLVLVHDMFFKLFPQVARLRRDSSLLEIQRIGSSMGEASAASHLLGHVRQLEALVVEQTFVAGHFLFAGNNGLRNAHSGGWFANLVSEATAHTRILSDVVSRFLRDIPLRSQNFHRNLPVHASVLESMECIVANASQLVEEFRPGRPLEDKANSEFARLSEHDLRTVNQMLLRGSVGVAKCVKELPVVLADDGVTKTVPMRCMNVTVNKTVTDTVCFQQVRLSWEGRPCTLEQPNCTEEICGTKLVQKEVAEEECVPYLTLPRVAERYSTELSRVLSRELGSQPAVARAMITSAWEVAPLHSISSVVSSVVQLSGVVSALDKTRSSTTPTAALVTMVPASALASKWEVAHYVSGAAVPSISSLLWDNIRTLSRDVSNATSLPRALRQDAANVSSTIHELQAKAGRPDATRVAVLASDTPVLSTLITNVASLLSQLRHADVATTTVPSAVELLRILTFLGLGGGIDSGTLSSLWDGVIRDTSKSTCLADAFVFASTVSNAPASPSVDWLRANLVPSLACSGAMWPTVPATTTADAVELLSATTTVEGMVSELVLPPIPDAMFRAVQNVVYNAETVVGSPFASFLKRGMTPAQWVDLAALLEAIPAQVRSMLHDDDVRAQTVLCGSETEPPVFIAASYVVAACRSASSLVSKVAADALAGVSIAEKAALDTVATVSEVANALEALVVLAEGEFGLVSSRDGGATSIANVFTAAQQWRQTLVAVTASVPFGLLTHPELGGIAKELVSMRENANVVSAFVDVMTWVRNIELQGEHASASSLIGATDALNDVADAVSSRYFPSSFEIWRRSARLVQANTTGLPLEGVTEQLQLLQRDVPIGLFPAHGIPMSVIGAVAQPLHAALVWFDHASSMDNGLRDPSTTSVFSDISHLFSNLVTQGTIAPAVQLAQGLRSVSTALSLKTSVYSVGTASRHVADEAHNDPFGDKTGEVAWNAHHKLSDLNDGLNTATAEPLRVLVSALQHHDPELSAVRAGTAVVDRWLSRTCGSKDTNASSVSFCVQRWKDGSEVPEQCCPELQAMNLPSSSCGVSLSECFAFVTENRTGMPPVCCGRFRGSNVSHPECNPRKDCVQSVTAALNGGSEPIPTRCCIHPSTRDRAAQHDSCTSKTTVESVIPTVDDSPVGCARCALRRLVAPLSGQWSNFVQNAGVLDTSPATKRRDKIRTAVSAWLTEAEKVGKLDMNDADTATLSPFATAAVHATEMLDRHSGPDLHNHCLREAGFGFLLDAVGALSEEHIGMIALLAGDPASTWADVMDVIWTDNATDILIQGAWVGWSVAKRIVREQETMPLHFGFLLGPRWSIPSANTCSDVCNAEVDAVALDAWTASPSPMATCTASHAMLSVRQAISVTAPGVLSRLGRSVNLGISRVSEVLDSVQHFVSAVILVGDHSDQSPQAKLSLLPDLLGKLKPASHSLQFQFAMAQRTIPVSASDAFLTAPALSLLASTLEHDIASVAASVGGLAHLRPYLTTLVELLSPSKLLDTTLLHLGFRRATKLATSARSLSAFLEVVPAHVTREVAARSLTKMSFVEHRAWVEELWIQSELTAFLLEYKHAQSLVAFLSPTHSALEVVTEHATVADPEDTDSSLEFVLGPFAVAMKTIQQASQDSMELLREDIQRAWWLNATIHAVLEAAQALRLRMHECQTGCNKLYLLQQQRLGTLGQAAMAAAQTISATMGSIANATEVYSAVAHVSVLLRMWESMSSDGELTSNLDPITFQSCSTAFIALQDSVESVFGRPSLLTALQHATDAIDMLDFGHLLERVGGKTPSLADLGGWCHSTNASLAWRVDELVQSHTQRIRDNIETLPGNEVVLNTLASLSTSAGSFVWKTSHAQLFEVIDDDTASSTASLGLLRELWIWNAAAAFGRQCEDLALFRSMYQTPVSEMRISLAELAVAVSQQAHGPGVNSAVAQLGNATQSLVTPPVAAFVGAIAHFGGAVLLSVVDAAHEVLDSLPSVVQSSACSSTSVARGTSGCFQDGADESTLAALRLLHHASEQVVSIVQDRHLLELLPMFNATSVTHTDVKAIVGTKHLSSLVHALTACQRALAHLLPPCISRNATTALSCSPLRKLASSLDLIGISAIDVALQSALWAASAVENAYLQTNRVQAAVQDVADLVSLLGERSTRSHVVEAHVLDTVAGIRDSVNPSSVSGHLLISSAVLSLDSAMYGNNTKIKDSDVSSMQVVVDMLTPLSQPDFASRLSPREVSDLMLALSSSTQSTSSCAGCTVSVASLQQVLALQPLLRPVVDLSAAVMSVGDSRAILVAQKVFAQASTDSVVPSLPDGVVDWLSRVTEQAVPVVQSFVTGSSSELVQAAHNGAVDMTEHLKTALPTVSFNHSSMAAPFVAWHGRRIVSLLSFLNETLEAVEASTHEVIPPSRGSVDATGSSSVAEAVLTHPALHRATTEVVLAAKALLSSVDVWKREVGAVPDSVVLALHSLQDAFVVRCVHSCEIDESLTQAMIHAVATAGYVSAVEDVKTQPSNSLTRLEGIRSVLIEALNEVEAGVVLSRVAPSPESSLPNEASLVRILQALRDTMAKAAADGVLPAGNHTNTMLDAINTLSSFMNTAQATSFTPRVHRQLLSVLDELRGTIANAAQYDGLSLEQLHSQAAGAGDVDLQDAMFTMRFTLPLLSVDTQASSMRASLSALQASTDAMGFVVQFASVVDVLRASSLSEFDKVGSTAHAGAVQGALSWLGETALPELQSLLLEDVLDAGSLCESVLLSVVPDDRAANVVMVKLVDSWAAVEAALAGGEAAMQAASANAISVDNVGSFYELVSALTLWKHALVDASQRLANDDEHSWQDSELGQCVSHALDTIPNVHGERHDAAVYHLLQANVETQQLLQQVGRVSELVAAGASEATIQRLAADAAATVERRLGTATLVQAQVLADTFSGFVEKMVTMFMGDSPSAGDPEVSSRVVGSVNTFLCNTTDFLRHTHGVMLSAATRASAAAAKVRAFKQEVEGEADEAYGVLKAQMGNAKDVMTSVDGFLNVAETFIDDTRAMKRVTDAIVSLIIGEVDSRVQILVSTFNWLRDVVNDTEEDVLVAVDQAHEGLTRYATLAAESVSKVGGKIMEMVASKLDKVDAFVSRTEQQLDKWKEAASMALEMSSMLADIDTNNELKLGELSFVLSSLLAGVQFVEHTVETLHALRADVEAVLSKVVNATALVQPFMEAVPARDVTSRVFSEMRTMITSTQARAEKLKNELFAAAADVADRGVDAALDVVVQALLPIANALRRARAAVAFGQESLDGMFNLVDRREWFDEAMASLDVPLHFPEAVTSFLRSFSVSFLGGVPEDVAAADDVESAVVQQAFSVCSLDFSSVSSLNAQQLAQEATTTLHEMPSSIKTFETVANELQQLVDVAAAQECVQQGSCGIATLRARFHDVASMLQDFRLGLSSLQKLGQGLPFLNTGIAALHSCSGQLPQRITELAQFLTDFAVGSLVLPGTLSADPVAAASDGLSEVVRVTKLVRSRVTIMTSRMDYALSTFQDHISKSRDVVIAGSAALSNAITTFQGGTAWASSMAGSSNALRSVSQAAAQYTALISEADRVEGLLEGVTSLASRFLRAPVMRTPHVWTQFTSKAASLFGLMHEARSTVGDKISLLLRFADQVAKFLGVGELIKQDQLPWDQLEHCSDDNTPSGACVRLVNRSSDLYRHVVFPALYTRFWYETIPPISFSGSKPFQRAVLPALFEEYIPRGVSHLDASSYFVSLQPIGSIGDRPALLVRMARHDNGGIMRLFQLYSAQDVPFNGTVSDVAVTAAPVAAMVWTCDDTQTGPSFATRSNLLLAFRLSDFVLSTSTGPPVAVVAEQQYHLHVAPSALHFDNGVVSPSPSLWVVEFAEPVALERDGRASSQQGPAKFGSGVGPATTRGSVKRRGGRNKRSKPRTVRLPPTQKPVNQKRRRRQTAESVDKPSFLSPVAALTVDSAHASGRYQQAGWAVRHVLTTEGDLVGAVSSGAKVTPQQALFVGEGVRGFGLVRQLGTAYAAVQRCSYRSGYVCRVEFHSLAAATSVGSVVVGGTRVPYSELDPGVPPDARDAAGGSGSADAVPPDTSSDPTQQDRNTRRLGDRRRQRPKRTRSKRRRTRTTRREAKQKRQSGGVSSTPEASYLGDRGATIASMIRLPSGATGFSYASAGVDASMMFLFSSASEPYLEHVLASGHDQEDSVHNMLVPALATVPPKVTQNMLFVKYRGRYKISPRCLFPIGDKCGRDSSSRSRTKSKKGGAVKPTRRPRRRLDMVSPAPPAAYAIHQHAYGRSSARVPETTSFFDRHAIAARQSQTSMTADSQALAAHRQLSQTQLEQYSDPARCLDTSFSVLPPVTATLFRYSQYILVYAIMVEFRITISVFVGVDMAMTVCLMDRVVSGSIIPSAAVEVALFIGTTAGWIAVGLEGAFTMMELTLRPTAALGFKNGVQSCLALDVLVRPISVTLYYRVFLFGCMMPKRICVKVFGKKICFMVLLPDWCPPLRFPFFTWDGPVLGTRIFQICTDGPDSTPPDIQDAFVSAKQTDAETIAVSWGGFVDKESGIKGYTSCIGSSPGSQDIAACVDAQLDQSMVFSLLQLDGLDGATAFVSVFARNRELIEAVLVDSLVIDDSGPAVVEWTVLREFDGTFVDEPVVKTSNRHSVSMRLHVTEDNPEEHIRVALVETAIGLGPLSFQDAAAWSELTVDWASKPRMMETSISGLELQHGALYYLHVRTTNTLGRQAITTARTRLFVDLTPPTLERVEPHNGASIMLEDTLQWLALDEPTPQFSATFWQVGAFWSFVDPESEIAEVHLEVLSASGDPTVPLASLVVQPEDSIALLDDVNLQHGETFSVSVSARSVANLWVTRDSEVVTMDLTAPFARQAIDLGNASVPVLLSTLPEANSSLARGFQRPEFLSPAQEHAVDVDFVTSLPELRVGFGAWDEDSGIVGVLIACGNAPGSTSVLDWTFARVNGLRAVTVPLPSSFQAEPHVRYHISVAAVNGARAVSAWTSTDGVMIDDTGPVCVAYRIRDGVHSILDMDFSADAHHVTLQWRSAVVDLESYVHHYEVRLEDSASGMVLSGPFAVGLSTRFTFSDLLLSHNQHVRCVVTGVNRAGGTSDCATDGVLIDLTGPVALTAPAVLDGNTALWGFHSSEGTGVDFVTETESAFATWRDIVDPESGVAKFWVWTETMDGTPLTDEVWVHRLLNEWTMDIPTMQHGESYRVAVRAENRASSATVFRSSGVTVDLTPPEFVSAVRFQVHEDDVGLDPFVIRNASARLFVSVEAHDGESGIRHCRYALSTYPDGSDVTGVLLQTTADMAHAKPESVDTDMRQRGGGQACDVTTDTCSPVPVTELPVDTTVRMEAPLLTGGRPLQSGFSLYSWVVCVNGAGSFVRARATPAFRVDTVPPVAGLVYDGLEDRAEIDFSPSNETFAGHWRWWQDWDTGIRFYEAALGTSPGSDDAYSWTNVGLQHKVFFSMFGDNQLQHGVRYYVSVRATDHAGHATVGSSDGVIIDMTPPQQGEVEHGLADIPVRRYTHRNDVVLMQWTQVDDPESGVTGFEYGLSSTPSLSHGDQPDMVSFTHVGLSRQAVATDLSLRHGHVYYGAVRTKNGVGMRSVSFSRGVMVDQTPPTCNMRDGGRGDADIDFSTSGVPTLYVKCEDMESGVVSMMWGLGTVPGWTDVVPLTPTVVSALEVPAFMESVYPAHVSDYHKSAYRWSDTEIASLTTTLLDGVRYYGVSRAENGAGTPVFSFSDGQVHDTSPPVALFVLDVLEETGSVDVQFTDNTHAWGVMFDIRDPHTGLGTVVVELVTDTDRVEETLDSVDVTERATNGVTRIVRRRPVPLPVGQRLWVRIRAENGAGIPTSLQSSGWTVDTTPPMFTMLPLDGVTGNVDALFHTHLGSLGACWEASDPESQVTGFWISVARVKLNTSSETIPELVADTSNILSPWAQVARSASTEYGIRGGQPYVTGVTCAFVSGFAIQQGEAYRVVISAENAVGFNTTAASSGVVVDWTPPFVGLVVVGPHAATGSHSFVQAVSTSLTVAWSNVVDAESDVVHMRVGLGTFPGRDDIVPRQAVPHNAPATGNRTGHHTWHSLSLRDGRRYYATVWATNRAGLVAERSSLSVLVDTTPPLFAELAHIPLVPAYLLPREFDSQSDYPLVVTNGGVKLPLLGFSDPHSPIAEATVEVYVNITNPAGVSGELLELGTAHRGDVLVPSERVDVSEGLYMAVVSPLNLTNGTYLWAVVTVRNAAGLSLATASRAVLVRTEGVTPGIVNDGAIGGDSPSQDIAYQASTFSFSARWSGFSDPNSIALSYKACVGTLPGMCDVHPWISTGREESLDILQNFSVSSDTRVFATVEATNDLGVSVQAFSNGMIMGASPPVVNDVRFVSYSMDVVHVVDRAAGTVYLATTPLVVVWNTTWVQPVDECIVEVFNMPGVGPSQTPVLAAVVNGTESVAVFNATFVQGTVLYATVTCTNVRGVAAANTTVLTGVVETSAPIPGFVSLGLQPSGLHSLDRVFTANTSHAAVHWADFVDQESGIVNFTVCLGSPHDQCSQGEYHVGTDQLAVVEAAGVNLTHGTEYVWTVTATNGGGLTSDAVSPPMFIDTLPPSSANAFVVEGIFDTSTNEELQDSDAQTTADFVEVAWGGFHDDSSGIHHYIVSLFWADTNQKVLPSQTVPHSESTLGFGNLSTVFSHTGGRVFATVRCIDAVGNWIEVNSSGVTIDGTPPLPPRSGIIEMFNASSSLDVDLQTSTSLFVQWGDFQDPETGTSCVYEDVTVSFLSHLCCCVYGRNRALRSKRPRCYPRHAWAFRPRVVKNR